jgi:hypothetical protein
MPITWEGIIMKTILVVMTLILTACAAHNGMDGATGQPGPPGLQPPTPAVPSATQVVVSEYNEQRAAIGQELISQGLQCTLYTVPSTTTAIIGATLTTVGQWEYNGAFNQANGPSSPGFNMLPVALQPLYTSYYVIKCTGLLIVPTSAFYAFSISNDDGANLYVNGLLINNDGVHAVSTKSTAKYLARGVASFEVDFFDTGGSKALIVNQNGTLLPAANLYH